MIGNPWSRGGLPDDDRIVPRQSQDVEAAIHAQVADPPQGSSAQCRDDDQGLLCHTCGVAPRVEDDGNQDDRRCRVVNRRFGQQAKPKRDAEQ